MNNLKISINDLFIDKRKNDYLILNRETGRWIFLSGYYDSFLLSVNKKESLCIQDIKALGFNDEIINKLIEENILITDTSKIKIEKPCINTINLIIIDTTEACNLNCKYCSVNSTINKKYGY